MNYPKLPNGPTGQGTAAARALDSAGSPFQTIRGVDFKSQLKDGFARVEKLGGVIYRTRGTYKSGVLGYYGATDYRQAFHRGLDGAGVNCDLGVHAMSNPVYQATETGMYTYPRSPSANETREFKVLSFLDHIHIGLKRVNNAPPLQYFSTYSVAAQPSSRPVRTQTLYMGRHKKDDTLRTHAISLYLSDRGRVDGAGRKLSDPTITHHWAGLAPVTSVLPIPLSLANTEFEMPVGVVTKNFVYVIVAERFSTSGPRDLTRDYRPRFWLLTSSDKGETWTTRDVRDPLAGRLYEVLPLQAVGWPGHPVGFPETASISLDVNGHATASGDFGYTLPSTGEAIYPFGIADGGSYNAALQIVVRTMTAAAVHDDKAVFSYSYYDAGSSALRREQRTLLVGDGGDTVASQYTDLASPAYLRYFQSLVYVGENTLIAKEVEAEDATLAGIDLTVRFAVSTDGGLTWTRSAPTGFPSALKNQYFGNLFVDTRRTIDKPAVVLITHFDTVESAYYVFYSKDYGASWKRGARIARPDYPYRVDSMLQGDGGGNFEDLTATAMQSARPVDAALPKRYARKAS